MTSDFKNVKPNKNIFNVQHTGSRVNVYTAIFVDRPTENMQQTSHIHGLQRSASLYYSSPFPQPLYMFKTLKCYEISHGNLPSYYSIYRHIL